MQKTKILLLNPKPWNLMWGHEKELVKVLCKKYDITILDFLDYFTLKNDNQPSKEYKIIYRKTNLRPGALLGLLMEFSNLKHSLKEEYDVLLTYLTAGGVLASIISRLRGKKVVLVYADDLPELHKKSSWLGYALTRYLANPIVALCSNKIFVTARLLKNDMTYGDNTKKIPVYIPNGVNLTDYFVPKNHNIKTDKKKKFTLGFVGGFGDWVNFEMILEYAKKHSNISILLVGDGIQYTYVKEKSKRLKNGNCSRTKTMNWCSWSTSPR